MLEFETRKHGVVACTVEGGGGGGPIRVGMSLPLHPADPLPRWREDRQLREMVRFAVGDEFASKVGRPVTLI